MGDDYKESALRRRVIRNVKVSDEHKSTTINSKNTKRWCKGKVGKEHILECRSYNELKNRINESNHTNKWRILICTACGKELSIYYGRKDKPNWVDK